MSPLGDSSLDLLEKSPRIRWSKEMRIIVCCLKKYFEENQDFFQAIFNKQFEKELAECGFKGGCHVKWPALHSQWTWMKSRKDRIWTDVHLTPNSDPGRQQPFIEMIEETAASLDLRLARKDQNTGNSSGSTYQTPVSFHRSEVALSSPKTPLRNHLEPPQQPLAAPRDETFELEQTPSKASLCTAGGKTCFWCYTEGLNKKPEDTPSLLHRWYNVDSQGVNSKAMFVAGFFTDAFQSYFEPDTITEEEFRRAFENHIRPIRPETIPPPSPFISTFQSALAPVHRSLQKQEGASVAIIETAKLKSRVYSAMEFVRKHKLKVTRTYNGAGEWLVWGYINSEALVCTFKVTDLQRIARENPDIGRFLQLDTIAADKQNRWRLKRTMAEAAVPLDKRAGVTVGKLLSLLRLPERYCREVSEGMAYSWRVKTRQLP
ncbi:uncharacterized protein BDV17DRAFT_151072 [Aspergillus undulatus]|uniref:uncharacterized protein n=1 Tax=Aspergillus undulatus TaxID=1810928 RepID=UPI003CCD30AE